MTSRAALRLGLDGRRRRRDEQHLERLGQHGTHVGQGGGVQRRLAAVHRRQVPVRVADEGEQLADGRGRVEVVVHVRGERVPRRLGARPELRALALRRRLAGVGDAEVQVGEGVAEPAVGRLRLVQLLDGELQRAAVVRREEVHQHDGRVVAVEDLAQQEDVADALGHLLALAADHAVVHPHAREGQPRRLGLRDLVLVVREDEVAAAAVHVEAGAQVAQAHRRALDVPARAAHPPGALPGGLAGLGRLPDGEVQRVLLAGLALDADAAPPAPRCAAC